MAGEKVYFSFRIQAKGSLVYPENTQISERSLLFSLFDSFLIRLQAKRGSAKGFQRKQTFKQICLRILQTEFSIFLHESECCGSKHKRCDIVENP